MKDFDTRQAAVARGIDPDRGVVSGAGALQRVEPQPSAEFPVGDRIDALGFGGRPEADSYYGLPLLKEPVWMWAVPAYLYLGGMAGAAATLAATVQVSGEVRHARLVHRARWLAVGGTALGAGLLIHDLGRPERFLNMLRVFRPTSAMNLGTWILTASGIAGGVAALCGERRGALGRIGRAATLTTGALGLLQSTYTGVLLAGTANPIWQGASRALPALFATSAMASVASLFELMPLAPAERRLVRRYAVIGKASGLAVNVATERSWKTEAERAPLKKGRAGALWMASTVMGVASLALSLWPGERRWTRTAAGLLGTGAALALRFGMLEAGKASARDPHATIEPQRRRLALRPEHERTLTAGSPPVAEVAAPPPSRLEP